MELSVERPVGPLGLAGGVARLTVHFEPGPEGTGPTEAELKSALARLIEDLDAVLGAPAPSSGSGRPERELTELVETYRPRRRELVDALLADGELTATEHDRLIAHLASAPRAVPSSPASTAPAIPVADHPIAAAPVVSDQSLPAARPIAELLRTYQIESLKQAGAVRARRQISFAEYMALKRHFESTENEGAGPGGLR